ncbi:Uncharacterised protein [Mycobacteroides abscessus]|nr:Uncharacterised protein [Mycobacteroides abscessus]CPX13983.1 Uncharacterised protein [Mycobacteroides abscessus]CPX14487.1 Uncharacterised protein [Mycobacteroides abscessus]CPZ99424.1 Uncharacterised protein [Mycobacteroides abscessus]
MGITPVGDVVQLRNSATLTAERNPKILSHDGAHTIHVHKISAMDGRSRATDTGRMYLNVSSLFITASAISRLLPGQRASVTFRRSHEQNTNISYLRPEKQASPS